MIVMFRGEGASNLAALARTKLMLTTADRSTVEFCSGIVGNREVREWFELFTDDVRALTIP